MRLSLIKAAKKMAPSWHRDYIAYYMLVGTKVATRAEYRYGVSRLFCTCKPWNPTELEPSLNSLTV